MSTKKLSIISIDRAKTILACYGGEPSAWPEQERDALLRVLKNSEILRSLQDAELAIDAFMDFPTGGKQSSIDYPLTEQCAENIMDRLPRQDQQTTGNAKRVVNFINQPLLLAASLMLLVLGLSNNVLLNQPQDTVISLSEFMAIYDDEKITRDGSIELSDELALLAYIEPQLLEDFN